MAELGAGSGSGYPAALDTDGTIETSADLAREDVPNDLANAIIAIETELGTDPAGSLTDVKTRLAVAINNDGTLKPIALNGTPDDHSCNGIVTSTYNAGYSSAVMDLVFMGTGGKWLECDADAVATCKGQLGIALEAKNNGEAMKVALWGFVRDDTWNWTVGATLYAGETLGAMQEAIPTGADAIIKVCGVAFTADIIFFNPSSDQQSTVA